MQSSLSLESMGYLGACAVIINQVLMTDSCTQVDSCVVVQFDGTTIDLRAVVIPGLCGHTVMRLAFSETGILCGKDGNLGGTAGDRTPQL